jgi:hypothetical protein
MQSDKFSSRRSRGLAQMDEKETTETTEAPSATREKKMIATTFPRQVACLEVQRAVTESPLIKGL